MSPECDTSREIAQTPGYFTENRIFASQWARVSPLTLVGCEFVVLQPRCEPLLEGVNRMVFQKGDGRVHLAPLPLRHDDPERLHHVLERLEPVASVADDVHLRTTPR